MKLKDILDNHKSEKGVISVYNEDGVCTVMAVHQEKLSPLFNCNVVESHCKGGNLYIEVSEDEIIAI